MTYTSAVTQKGQITLPKAVRNKLNIKIRERVSISLERGYIKILPTKDILSIAGFLKDKVKKGVSITKSRESFERNYTRV